jgi:predicted ATPase
VVITGGPGTGKTSIINALKEREFHCFEEIIRSLTVKAKKDHEASQHVSNPIAFINDPWLFNTNLLNGRIAQFRRADTIETSVSFFDRGIPDVLAYMSFFNQEFDDTFIEGCANNKYDLVFLLPPWKAIYKMDNERFETFEESTKIHQQLVKTYLRFGYNIIDVPHGSVEQRTDHIINIIDGL